MSADRPARTPHEDASLLLVNVYLDPNLRVAAELVQDALIAQDAEVHALRAELDRVVEQRNNREEEVTRLNDELSDQLGKLRSARAEQEDLRDQIRSAYAAFRRCAPVPTEPSGEDDGVEFWEVTDGLWVTRDATGRECPTYTVGGCAVSERALRDLLGAVTAALRDDVAAVPDGESKRCRRCGRLNQGLGGWECANTRACRHRAERDVRDDSPTQRTGFFMHDFTCTHDPCRCTEEVPQ